MNKLFVFCTLLLFFFQTELKAQGPFGQVYTLFQAKCNFSSCHSNQTQAGNLDLQGANGDWNAVYNSLVNVDPTNSVAKAKGNKLVLPGDPYRSFLFRKCNGGLDATNPLEASEGGLMPQVGSMTNQDKELVRQWILWGAKKTGDLIDADLINEYYTGNGLNSVAEPPAAPAEGEGFQIHLGPFFLKPNSEAEYFIKYPLFNAEQLEVNRTDCFIGQGFSHHFIAFEYTKNDGNYADGLRTNAAHIDNSIIAAFQEQGSIQLPQYTAFAFEPNRVLDLNTHYINASDKVLACHVYFNMHTQTVGTAITPMTTILIPNTNLSVPPTNEEVTIRKNFKLNQNVEIYIWSALSHTHKLGKGFKAFFRNSDGSEGEQFYDASKLDGDPNGSFVGYDYAHPPTRFFYPFLPMKANDGLIMEGKYKNPGPNTVTWGPTSEDEMMIIVLQYTLLDVSRLTAIDNPSGNSFRATLYPNPLPAGSPLQVILQQPEGLTQGRVLQLSLFDALGRETATFNLPATTEAKQTVALPVEHLPKGVYMFRLNDGANLLGQGKLIKN